MCPWSLLTILNFSTRVLTDRTETKNDLTPEITKDIFHFAEKPYNLRNNSTLKRRCNRSVYFGTETKSSLAPKIWESDPKKIRNVRVKITPLVVGCLGAILKQFGNRLKETGIRAEIGQVQKTVLLKTARILRKVLEI